MVKERGVYRMNLYIKKIDGWGHHLKNSLELIERDIIPITVQLCIRHLGNSEGKGSYEVEIPIEEVEL